MKKLLLLALPVALILVSGCGSSSHEAEKVKTGRVVSADPNIPAGEK